MQKRTLIVTEKPSVAKSIAAALGISHRKNGCYDGGEYAVAWCVGHLVAPAPPDRYGEQWKKWDKECLPLLPEQWKYEVKKATEKQYQILAGLMGGASEIVNACDAGREGELIFRLVYEMAECDKPVKRLWISSMEEKSIREGLASLKDGHDYDSLYRAALCRQRADWLVGLNGTRLFTVLYGGRVLKVGRVQTPTLAMIVEREEKIKNFQKEPYYVAHILTDGLDAVTERMDDKQKAEKIAGACQNGQALVTSVTKEEKTTAPPKLYDLTTLQRDANRLFGFTAKQTLEYTQSLYEKKLATYPRTDSRYLSDDMAQTAKNVAEAVSDFLLSDENKASIPNMEKTLDIKRILDSAKVTDHHAIIPTMEVVKTDVAGLPEAERKTLSLIANRLLCATGEMHRYETVRAELSCNGHIFSVSGKSITHNGWKNYEDAFKRSFQISCNTDGEKEEKSLPELSEGQTFDGVQANVSEHFTSAPKRFTEDSLLASMERAGAGDTDDDAERKGLGTPATRADTIEKLVKDGYVKREKKQIVPTEEGIVLVSILPDAVKSPKLTSEWENALALVASGKMDADAFMGGISEMVSGLVRDYKEAAVNADTKKLFASERAVLGSCPKCGGRIVTGKYGAYCEDKCGMFVAKYYSTPLSDSQVKNLLEGKQILLKDTKGRDGKPRDLRLEVTGIEEFSYEKNGKMTSGYRFSFKKSYPGKE